MLVSSISQFLLLEVKGFYASYIVEYSSFHLPQKREAPLWILSILQSLEVVDKTEYMHTS